MGFSGILRQSTAVNVIIGPFVDSADGDTEETGLTIAQADVRLSKNAGADAQKNDNTSCAHEGDGFYMCELDATDTNTVGQLTLWVHVAGALAVRHDFQIVEEAVYDALFASSAAGYGTAQTGDSFARLGAPAGASVSADILAIDNLVDDLESRVGTPSNLGGGATIAQNLSDIEAQTDDIGAAGAGLTAIPWNSNWDAEVQSEVNDGLVALNLDHLLAASVAGADVVDNSVIAKMVSKSATADWDSFANTTDSLEAAHDLLQLTYDDVMGYIAAIEGNLVTNFPALHSALYMRSATAQGGDSTSITLDAGASSIDDFYKDRTVMIRSGTGVGQSRMISSYNGTSKIALLNTAWHTNPDNTSGFMILAPASPVNFGRMLIGSLGYTESDVYRWRSAVANNLISGRVDANAQVVGDKTDYSLSAGGVTAVQSGLASQASVDDLPTNAELATALAAADDAVLAAVAALNNLAAGAAMTLTSAERNAIADALFARSLGTEAVSADGAVPTFAQAMFEMLGTLGEFSIAGTTITVKKRDGTTTLFTSTLDSSSAPTSRTRAT